MQLFQIVKNTGFSSSTTSVSSEAEIAPGVKPVLSNNYFVYQSTLGGNVVDDNNVRDFLDREDNIELAESFVKYLEQNTTIDEFKNIFYDNKKLSSVFNEFYRKKYLNKNTELSAISKNLQNTKSIGYKQNNFNSQESRLNGNKTVLIDTGSSEQNYYINIKIDKKINILPKGDYSEYFKDCVKGTYFDNELLYTNVINKKEIIVNIPYIKNQQNNISNNFGYAPVSTNTFNQNYVGNNIILPGDGRGEEFNYKFYTFNSFSNFFNYSPPKLTGTTNGIFINQLKFSTTGSNRDVQFVVNPMFQFNKQQLSYIEIPITIERINPITSNVFYVRYEKYSNAIIGKSFVFDINLESLIEQIPYNFNDYNTNSVTQNIFALKTISPEDTIVLSLVNYRNEIIDFLLIRCEEFLSLNSYSDESYILSENKYRNKLYLNCFVDYNYNDKDMEFYRNQDIKIVNQTQQTDIDL